MPSEPSLQIQWNSQEINQNTLNLDSNQNELNLSLNLQNLRKLSLESWEENSHHLLKNKILAQNGFSFGGKKSGDFSERNPSLYSKRLSLMTMDTFTSEMSSFSDSSQENGADQEERGILRDITDKYVKSHKKTRRIQRKSRFRPKKGGLKNKRMGVLRM